ncbi:MAG: Unknown protein [uncultured Thiotrichaceae bacterium]|uniref:Mth938-like domain-containing protein n=1 Tax=uncultured Thiotrichaceae bacterium TaxID=298394 RepID=A0A6S6TGR3_9GAMM|nr:MAG: Unknown protein [uncultured Thiotrichaceae bacterium]
MKFSEDSAEGHYHIQSYGEGWIQANQRRMERGFIIHTDRIIDSWEPLRYADLQPEHLADVFKLQAKLILIGTGEYHQLPTPEIHKALIQQQIGFEFMTTDAACRTYNVLLSEFRDVAAVLFPE